MQAEYVNHMGSDLTVVNAARVSMNKESEWEINLKDDDFSKDWVKFEKHLSDKDKKLIRYLSKHNHFTPFTHAMITLRETVPIFVARQRFKHTVGFSYNEVSRRYVDDTPVFFKPDAWRKRAENVKQGSSDEEVKPDQYAGTLYVDKTYEGNFGDIEGGYWGYEEIISLCREWYLKAIDDGVAPEQARMVLPQSMYTEYYVTGSLAAFARAYKLRSDPHAQKEIRDLADQWDEIIRPLFPESWAALVDEVN